MTVKELRDMVVNWDFGDAEGSIAESKYENILDQLDYHAANEWRVYLPAENPKFDPNYMERLASWIGNVSCEKEKKLLLEYALYISFFSHDDFVALYRTAMDREIMQWVAMRSRTRLDPHGWQSFQDLIDQEIHQYTWFCPVTDSMDINEFYKVNHLTGKGHRPGFSTLQKLAEDSGPPNSLLAENVKNYMQSENIRRIVLLEDMVGSGDQCRDAIRWAVSNLGKPILFVPLILCPNGASALQQEECASGGRLSVRPVIELHRGDLLGPERKSEQGWPIADDMENLACQYAPQVSDNGNGKAFGFSETGCSIVTFTNTPDNTIPLIHNKPNHGGWSPLFPRVYRD